MPRAIDKCTCSCGRGRHNTVAIVDGVHYETACDDCTCLCFCPHPQPNSVPPEKDFVGDLREFLNTYSGRLTIQHSRSKTDKTIMVRFNSGELWEIGLFRRLSPEEAALLKQVI